MARAAAKPASELTTFETDGRINLSYLDEMGLTEESKAKQAEEESALQDQGPADPRSVVGMTGPIDAGSIAKDDTNGDA